MPKQQVFIRPCGASRATAFNLKSEAPAFWLGECHLYTNGILLNAEKFSSLVKNLDVLVIDNYDDNFQLIPSVEKVLVKAPLAQKKSKAFFTGEQLAEQNSR